MIGASELMSKKSLNEIFKSLSNAPFNIDCSTAEGSIFAAEIVTFLQATDWTIYETTMTCGGDFVELEFTKRGQSFFLSFEHCHWLEISICNETGDRITSFSQSPLEKSIELIAKRKTIFD